MKLTVLTDNNTYIDKYYLGEPALSFYIEDGDKKILFDTGYSDVFIKNAKNFNIDLNSLDYIVISHGHNDHTGGLEHMEKSDAVLIAHPHCFEEKYHLGQSVGSPVSKSEIESKFNCIFTDEVYQITDKLLYLGQIPRQFSFENIPVGTTVVNGEEKEDFLEDDTALVYKGKDGLFIVTGCSHSGICNIVSYAKKVCKENKIQGVIGGFHLLETDDKLVRTIDYFVENDISDVYPCHCVSLKAKHLMMDKFNTQEVAVSLQLNIE